MHRKVLILSSSYEDLASKLKAILEPYNIISHRSNAFAEFILMLAGINKQFNTDSMKPYGDGGRCIFQFPLTKKEEKKLLLLNRKFPELKMSDMGKDFDHKGIHYKHFTMDILGLQSILPLFSDYLSKHRKEVREYSHCSHTYNYLLDILKSIFLPEGLDIETSDCFEQAICLMVKNSLIQSHHQAIHHNLTRHLPDVLLRMINDYAELTEFHLTQKSQFDPEEKDKCVTAFFLKMPAHALVSVEGFFNQLNPKCAKLHKELHDVKDLGMEYSKVMVANETLLSPGVLSEIKAVVKNPLYLSQFNMYRKASKSILETPESYLSFVNQTLSGNDLHKELLELIQELAKEYAKLEKTPKLDSLLEQVKQRAETLGEAVNTNPGPDVRANITILRMLSLVKTIEGIVNKRYNSASGGFKPL